MKRILILLSAILLGMSASAQQALFNAQSVESPVINPDGTITTRQGTYEIVDVITMEAGCKHTVIAETELQLIEVQLGSQISVADKHKYEME